MSPMWQAFPEQRQSRLMSLPTKLIEKIMDHVYETDRSRTRRIVLSMCRPFWTKPVWKPDVTEKRIVTLGIPRTVQPIAGQTPHSSKLEEVRTAISLWAGESIVRSDSDDIDISAQYRRYPQPLRVCRKMRAVGMDSYFANTIALLSTVIVDVDQHTLHEASEGEEIVHELLEQSTSLLKSRVTFSDDNRTDLLYDNADLMLFGSPMTTPITFGHVETTPAMKGILLPPRHVRHLIRNLQITLPSLRPECTTSVFGTPRDENGTDWLTPVARLEDLGFRNLETVRIKFMDTVEEINRILDDNHYNFDGKIIRRRGERIMSRAEINRRRGMNYVEGFFVASFKREYNLREMIKRDLVPIMRKSRSIAKVVVIEDVERSMAHEMERDSYRDYYTEQC